jgi:hypothetical protein
MSSSFDGMFIVVVCGRSLVLEAGVGNKPLKAGDKVS